MNTLRLGSTGDDVVVWQRSLKLPSDGIFGPQTEAATIAWQKERGLVADGIVGPASWKLAGVEGNSAFIVENAPTSIPVQGLDVSPVQGRTIPWAAERKRGSDFVFSRCHVGNNTWTDPTFAENSQKASDAGLFVGAYFFPFPLPHLKPIDQVKLFLQSALVRGHVLGTERGELPPAYDLEWPPPEEWAKWKCTADQIVDWSIECIEALVEQIGRQLVVYSYPYFLSALSKAKNFAKLMTSKLWIAGGNQYLNGDGHIPDLNRERPPKVAGWGSDWLFWQHDGNGGRRLTHGVDADFNVFRMSYDELARLCRVEGTIEEEVPDTLPELSVILQSTSKLIVEDGVHAFRKRRAEEIFLSGV